MYGVLILISLLPGKVTCPRPMDVCTSTSESAEPSRRKKAKLVHHGDRDAVPAHRPLRTGIGHDVQAAREPEVARPLPPLGDVAAQGGPLEGRLDESTLTGSGGWRRFRLLSQN